MHNQSGQQRVRKMLAYFGQNFPISALRDIRQHCEGQPNTVRTKVIDDDASSLLHRFESISTWHRGSERAPHKPLLLLLALGLFSRGIRALPFFEYEQKITELLREFGPSRRSLHPEYPFWRLRHDGVWEVTAQGELKTRASNNDVLKSQLRSGNAIGYFPLELQRKFSRHPRGIVDVAEILLSGHFPQSLHQDILDAVGLSMEIVGTSPRHRDPNFRHAVLGAYQYRCALCGLDLRMGNVTIGLEAAHIKWHQARGPDAVENGLALCSLHHKLFDLGAFTFEINRQVLVSEQVHGTGEFEQVLLRHHGQQLNEPVHTEQRPHHEFVKWHREEVFKASPRPFKN